MNPLETDCPCMLCSNCKKSAAEQKKSPIRHYPKPTILCPYIDYWRSMWNICCCLLHPDCDFKNFGSCGCPSCCVCTRTATGVDPSITPCDTCQQKISRFIPCNHGKGFCKTYSAVTAQKSKNAPVAKVIPRVQIEPQELMETD